MPDDSQGGFLFGPAPYAKVPRLTSTLHAGYCSTEGLWILITQHRGEESTGQKLTASTSGRRLTRIHLDGHQFDKSGC